MKYIIITTHPQKDCIEVKGMQQVYAEKSSILAEGYTIKSIDIACDCEPDDLRKYGCMCGAGKATL